MGFVQHGYGNASREPFGGGGSPGAFLNEICASFDGTGGADTVFTESLTPGLVHAPMGANTGYRMDGVPASRPIPVPMAPGSARSRQNGSLVCSEAEVGQSSLDGGSFVQKTPDTLTHLRHSCQCGNASAFRPNCAVSRCFPIWWLQ